MTKKWGDPKLDAAQFAMDKFHAALDHVGDEITRILDEERAGTATPADMAQFEELKNRWVKITQEIGDIGNRLLHGATLPPPNVN